MSQPAPASAMFSPASATSPPRPSSATAQATGARGFQQQLQSVQGKAASAAKALAGSDQSETAQGQGKATSGTLLEGLVAQVLSGNALLNIPSQSEGMQEASGEGDGEASVLAALAALQAELGLEQGAGDAQQELVALLQQLQGGPEKGDLASWMQGSQAPSKGMQAVQELLQHVISGQQSGSKSMSPEAAAELAARLRSSEFGQALLQAAAANGEHAAQGKSRAALQAAAANGEHAAQLNSRAGSGETAGALFQAGEGKQGEPQSAASGSTEAAILRALQNAASRAEMNQEMQQKAAKQAPWQQLAPFAIATGQSGIGQSGQSDFSLAGLIQQGAVNAGEQEQAAQQVRQALLQMSQESQQTPNARQGHGGEIQSRFGSQSGQNNTSGNSDGSANTGFGQYSAQTNSVGQSGGQGRAYQSATPFETQVMEQVRMRFQAGARQGQSEMVVRMHPPELGEVRLNLTSDDGILRAQLHAQSQQVHDILERHAPQLRQALADQGIDLDDLLVSSDSAEGQGQASEWQNAENGSSGQPGHAAESNGEAENNEQTDQDKSPLTGNAPGALSLRV